MKIIFILLLITFTYQINFPYQSITLAVYNTNNNSYFNNSYYLSFAKSSNPLIITAINTLYINTSFSGTIIPSLTTSPPNYDMVQVDFKGTWNTSVPQLYLLVSILQANPNFYQSHYQNLTSASFKFAVNSIWNSTNCYIMTYLLGWQVITNSKYTYCYISSPGFMTCNNSKYNAVTSSFLYYNIIIYSLAWVNQNCPLCIIGGINSTTNYTSLPKTDPNGSYNYFCGFNYFGSTYQWVQCFQIPTLFALATGTNNSDSGIQLLTFPATPVILPNITGKMPTIPVGPNIPLIVGLVVGLSGLAIIIILIYVYSRKRFYKEQLQRIKNQEDRKIQRIKKQYGDKIPLIQRKLMDAKQKDCCLCLQNKCQVILLPCLHNDFCKACIQFNMSIVKQCPICRKVIDTVQSYQTYEKYLKEKQEVKLVLQKQSEQKLEETGGFNQSIRQPLVKLVQQQPQQQSKNHIEGENLGVKKDLKQEVYQFQNIDEQ